MIDGFGNRIAQDIWEKGFSKNLPSQLHVRAEALLTIMHATKTMQDLKIEGQPPNIRLHKLTGDRKDEWSISLFNHSPWRITFRFNSGEFRDVKIENYHKG